MYTQLGFCCFVVILLVILFGCVDLGVCILYVILGCCVGSLYVLDVVFVNFARKS